MTKKSLTIASWNVNSLRVRLPHVLTWLANNHIDILALQETKTIDEQFPTEAFSELGYHICFTGQKTYNGVAIISRYPMTNIIREIPGYDDPQKRFISATIENIRIVNLYVPNGQSVDSDKYQYKLNWLSHVTALTKQFTKESENILLLGDFNIAPADQDVHDPKKWMNSVLVSEKERQALKDLMQAGHLYDCYRLFEQADNTFSWWDYRAHSFRRNLGLRIDLLLASKNMADICTNSNIDKTPRSWERPSDHAPIMATFSA